MEGKYGSMFVFCSFKTEGGQSPTVIHSRWPFEKLNTDLCSRSVPLRRLLEEDENIGAL